MSNKFYITTAIDYPNGSPHLGHAYEKTITDCYARWYRFLGKDVHFLTGTDENGQKLIETAKAENVETSTFVDANVEIFKKLCTDLNISNNDFIRTTEDRHHKTAAHFWTTLEKKGDVYAGKYSGNYCMGCESFYTELQAPDGICPEHHKELQLKEEEGFFFKLSNYHDWIVDYIKSNADFVVPRSAHKEILSRLNQEPLKDLAISRPSAGWGVSVPGNDQFVMYTWFDALINYVSALSEDQKALWPADVHVIGKDILFFHSVIWPCMLKAMGMELPKQIYVHGMVLAEDGKKMSKSLGNGVDPFDMLDKYPLDTFRYYLLKNISSMSDGSFSERELVDKHNTELGNDFGNLIMRVVKLSLKNLDPEIKSSNTEAPFNFPETFDRMKDFMNKREHHKAFLTLWESMNLLNQYVNDSAPWKLKDNPKKLTEVVYDCLYGIHCASVLLSPYLPDTANKALEPLGVKMGIFEDIKYGEVVYNLTTPEPLFPKIDAIK